VVIVAHFSHMRYGTGSDHIIFGRILFALFMLVLFFVGVKFSDRTRAQEVQTAKPPSSVSSVRWLIAAAMLATGIVVSIAAIAKSSASRASLAISAHLPAPREGWAVADDAFELGYSPRFRGFDQSLAAAYELRGSVVELHEVVYLGVRQDSELVNQQNRLFDPEAWRLSTRARGAVSLADGRAIEFETATLYRPAQRLRVHSYYIVGNRWTASRIGAKLFEIYDLVFRRSSPRAFIAVATPLQLGQESAADDILNQFIREHHDRLQLCLSGGNTSDDACLAADSTARLP
jgi:EpsI family protein